MCMSSAQPTRCELQATALDDAGAGIGASGATAVHVGDLLPGERAEVMIDHFSPHRPEAWGRIVNDFVQVIRLADGRVSEVWNYYWDQRAIAEFMPVVA